ncbi:MAG: Smr/MutS family protein [Pseudomonadota bacterium]
MKRVVPPDTGPAEPPAPRRRRLLSAEERSLWHAVADSTKPLKKRPRLTRIAAAETATKDAAKKVADKAPSATGKRTAVPTPARRPEPPPLAAIGRRERLQLSRGRKDIDARLDLHGMTQARAHRVLLHFLQQASEEGLSFVLVITGKGRTTAEAAERGVLRRQVPEWLALPEFRACVVGFEEAHVGHGGGGALYVRIRRARHR